jgi:hypothetical protein
MARQGWEGQVLTGTAGSTASTVIENTKDMSEDKTTEKGNTTVRGQSSAAPVNCESVSVRGWSFEFTMINKAGDTVLEGLRTAEANGTPVALRTRDHVSGKGYDGDVNLESKHGMPLSGEQTIVFSCTANNSLRAPQLYV